MSCKGVVMTQLTIDVPDDIAEQFKQQAAQAGLSLSRYFVELGKRAAETMQKKPDMNHTFSVEFFKDKISIAEDFDEPLPDSFWLEGKL
jgi:hypothetical protein